MISIIVGYSANANAYYIKIPGKDIYFNIGNIEDATTALSKIYAMPLDEYNNVWAFYGNKPIPMQKAIDMYLLLISKHNSTMRFFIDDINIDVKYFKKNFEYSNNIEFLNSQMNLF